MSTGSRAPAIAVFMSTPSQPSSIAIAASDAVPTPASTRIGTLAFSTMMSMLYGLQDAETGADGRGERHDGDAPHLLEALRHDGIVVRVHHHLEPFAHEDLGGRDGLRDVGEQRALVAQHLELHQRDGRRAARARDGSVRTASSAV